MSLRGDEVLEAIQRLNEPELRRRRDYYAYLDTKGPQDETFEQHLDRYANLIRTGERATEGEISELEALAATRIPEELRAFYLTIGRIGGANGFSVSPVTVHSVPDLVARLRSLPSDRPREWIRSAGLIDMMKLSWGNDRFELEPENGLVTEAEVERLNAAYTCVGWCPSEPGLEANDYIYFDASGAFGTVGYHQDDFDALYAASLRPMLDGSSACRTFSEIVLAALGNPYGIRGT